MQPFRVICETCAARLKVTSESAIGQIHACPKCGSMVHVQRPDAAFDAPADSTAVLDAVEVGTPVISASYDFEVALPSPAGDETAPPPLLPSGTGQTTTGAVEIASRKSSLLLYYALGGFAAAAVMIGGVTALLRPGTEVAHTAQAPVVNQSTGSTADADAAEVPAQPQSSASEEVLKVDGDTKASDEAPSSATAEVDESDPVDAATERDASPETALPPLPAAEPSAERPSSPDGVATADTKKPEGIAQPTAVPEPIPDPPSAKPVMKFDPLDFDPAQWQFHEGNTPTESKSIAEGDASVQGGGGDAEESPKPGPEPTLQNDADVDRSIHVERGQPPNGAASSSPAADGLSVKIDSLAVSDMPLQQLVELVSELSGASITLSPEQMALAGVSPRQTVSIEASDVTAREALANVLTKLRLELVEERDGAGIALTGSERQRAVVYEVADLTGGEDATEIAALIARFVSPASWKRSGGSGTMEARGSKVHIEHTQSHRHQVLIFLEQLRLAQGLPLRSRYPAELLATRSAFATLSPRLRQTTTFTFLPWTPLGEVFHGWQESSGMTVLVDWQALASKDLSPRAPIACSAANRTWQDVLDEILEPLGLAWRAVDGQTIQVTSQENLDELRQIEFHAIPDKVLVQAGDTKGFIQTLTERLRMENALPAKSDFQFEVYQDRTVIVLATPTAHRVIHSFLDSAQ